MLTVFRSATLCLILSCIGSTSVTAQSLDVKITDDAQVSSPAAREHFRAIDHDKDGKISPQEMQDWRIAKFKSRDLDLNFIITRGELLEPGLDSSRALSWDETVEFLMAYDENGDQEVSLEEMSSIISKIDIFPYIDHNGDGFIIPAEAEGFLDISPVTGVDKSRHPDRTPTRIPDRIPPNTPPLSLPIVAVEPNHEDTLTERPSTVIPMQSIY